MKRPAKGKNGRPSHLKESLPAADLCAARVQTGSQKSQPALGGVASFAVELLGLSGILRHQFGVESLGFAGWPAAVTDG